MGWSWKIARVAGIDVYIHGTFFLLMGFVLLSDWGRSQSLATALVTVAFLLAIFGTVVLHEFGHALTARRYGIKTRDITLLPIGGLARLERMPDVPRQELWVALAGPAVNVVIAAVGLGLSVLLTGALPRLGIETPLTLLDRFITVNVFLAAFNLIPAFPMDGGRALRALLAERMDYVRATEIAASLGQGLALLFGFVGLFANPILIFIALFVWMGASAESSMVSIRSALAGLPVSRAMITDFRALGADDTLQAAIALVLAGTQHDFPVIEHGRLVGILTRDRLMTALAEKGVEARVDEVMSREFETADAREMLEPAFQRLQGCACPVLPVIADGRLVGLLTADNVGEFVMIRGALGARAR
jgi:Zn-dependent protease/CBS domain-containing protein